MQIYETPTMQVISIDNNVITTSVIGDETSMQGVQADIWEVV